MPATELWHVNVVVTDVGRALSFYRHFGLGEIARTGAPSNEGAWLRFPDGRELHLSAAQAAPRSRAHFAILVDDLDETRAALTAAGAEIEGARDLPGYARFFTRDPDGNRVEVAQRV